MKQSKTKGNTLKWMILFTMFCTAVFLYNMGGNTKAAPGDYHIYNDLNDVTGGVVSMRSATIALYTDSIDPSDTYEWTVLGNSVEIISGANSQNIRLRAVSANASTIQLIVTHPDDTSDILTCRVDVVFCVDESKPSMKYIYSTDERKSLVMTCGEDFEIGNDIDLVFGDATATTTLWTSGNDDVIQLSGHTIFAMGAGRTTLSVSCDDGAEHWEDTIDVYVRPKISYLGNDNTTEWTMTTGGIIEATMLFQANPVLSANDKLAWVIYRDVEGSNVLVQDSLGNKGENSDMASLTYSSINGGYRLTAVAGEYYVAFYVVGTYRNFDEAQQNPPGCEPVVAKVTVLSNFNNKEITLTVGGTYDLAKAFNIFGPDFLSNSNFVVDSMDPGNPYNQYLSYDARTGILTATRQGTARVKVTLQNRSLELPGLTNEQVELIIVVTNQFTLNYSSYTMYTGATLELYGIFSSGETPMNSTFEWTTSNETLAQVDGAGINAIVTANRATPVNQPVVITLHWTDENGLTQVATCLITIRESIRSIKITPAVVEMEVGDVRYLQTDATGDVNFSWFSSNTNIVTVQAQPGNNAAQVTAGRITGEVTVTVINMDNNVSATCKVIVSSAIQSISIDKGEEYEVMLLQEYVQMLPRYTPANATSTDLIWSSSDPSVATVNATGLVTLRKAGITIITVQPQFNPNMVMAQCRLTVTTKADEIKLSQNNLTVAVGETYQFEYTLKPEGADTVVTYSSLNPSVATVDAQGLVRGIRGGNTMIVAVTQEGKVDTCNVKVVQGITQLALASSDVTINVGQQYQAKVTWTPADATETALTWTSQDAKIAAVSQTGVITGIAPGETWVVVSAPSTSTTMCAPYMIKVTVKTPLSGIALSPASKTIAVGQSYTLSVIYTPPTASNKGVIWTTGNANVATVANGVVKGVGQGTTMITCRSVDGSFTATATVTVQNKTATLVLNKTSISIGKGKKYKLVATLNSNYNATSKFKWKSSKKKVATVSKSGVVTGKKLGKATVTVSTADNKYKAKCTVRVINKVTSIKLNQNYMQLAVGRSKKLKAKVKPSKATNKKIKWSTGNSEIAIVSSSGKVTGVAEGKTIITASAKDGSGKQAQCTVVVSPLVPASSVMVSQSKLTMVKGETTTLSVKMLPSNTTDGLKYATEDKKVATVSQDGVVTAVGAGDTTITVMTDSGQTATVDVTVIALNKSTVSMRQYDTETIWVEGTTDAVTWFSANPRIATVTNGKILGKKKGKTSIYATVNGTRLRCRVTVKKLK